MIKFDGCLGLTIGNWQELQTVRVCCKSDKTGPAAVLSLMFANWPDESKV